jgi:hypothetical protein
MHQAPITPSVRCGVKTNIETSRKIKSIDGTVDVRVSVGSHGTARV